MPLSIENSDFISRGRNSIAPRLLAFRAEIEIELGQWNLTNMFSDLNDADIAAIFPSLTKSEVTEYVNAMKAFLIALGTSDGGDPVHNDTSSQAANLIKIMR